MKRPGRLRTAAAALAACLLTACGSGPGRAPAKAPAVDLLVQNGIVLTMDAGYGIYQPGFVAIKGRRIEAVGPMSDASRFAGAETLDASGMIVMPGLINTHTHAPMTLLRGLGGDSSLMEWLQKYIFPAEARNVNPDLVKWGTQLACYEMIQSGTTAYVDMYYFEEAVAAETKNAGMRAVLGETILDMPVPDNKTVAEALDYTRRFIAHWKDDPLITPAVAPHAPYTCSRNTLLAAHQLARESGVPLVIHLSETADEVRTIMAQTGATPAAYLESLGLLDESMIAAHAVWITDDEIPLLQKHGVGISHNPESNMKLASGVAPLQKFLHAGLRIGLGTDGAASNNNLDLFEEVDTMAKLHKLWLKDPGFLPAREALRIATAGGAAAIHREKDLGSLEAGKLADLILVRTDEAPAMPLYDPYVQLAYSLKGHSVDTNIIDGRVVMRGRVVKTLDLTAIRKNVERLQAQVLSSLKEPAAAPEAPSKPQASRR